MLNKKLILCLLILLLTTTVYAQYFIQTEQVTNNPVDIPTPINPVFIQQIKDCGKLGLIDRLNKNYNPQALVDGSLIECDN